MEISERDGQRGTPGKFKSRKMQPTISTQAPSPIITCSARYNLVLPNNFVILCHINQLSFAPLFLNTQFQHSHTYRHTPTHTHTHTHIYAHSNTCGLCSSPVGCGMGLAEVATAGIKIAQRTWQGMKLTAEGRDLVSLGKCEVLFLHSTRGRLPEGKLRSHSTRQQD